MIVKCGWCFHTFIRNVLPFLKSLFLMKSCSNGSKDRPNICSDIRYLSGRISRWASSGFCRISGTRYQCSKSDQFYIRFIPTETLARPPHFCTSGKNLFQGGMIEMHNIYPCEYLLIWSGDHRERNGAAAQTDRGERSHSGQ